MLPLTSNNGFCWFNLITSELIEDYDGNGDKMTGVKLKMKMGVNDKERWRRRGGEGFLHCNEEGERESQGKLGNHELKRKRMRTERK